MPQDQIQFAFQQKTAMSIMSAKRLFQMYLKGEKKKKYWFFLQVISQFFSTFLG